MRVRIVATEGGDRVTVSYDEAEVEAFVVPTDTSSGSDWVARRHMTPVIRVDEWPEHCRRPPDGLVEFAINGWARGEAGHVCGSAIDGGLSLDALATTASGERKQEEQDRGRRRTHAATIA
jgi:hypothetical protein